MESAAKLPQIICNKEHYIDILVLNGLIHFEISTHIDL